MQHAHTKSTTILVLSRWREGKQNKTKLPTWDDCACCMLWHILRVNNIQQHDPLWPKHRGIVENFTPNGAFPPLPPKFTYYRAMVLSFSPPHTRTLLHTNFTHTPQSAWTYTPTSYQYSAHHIIMHHLFEHLENENNQTQYPYLQPYNPHSVVDGGQKSRGWGMGSFFPPFFFASKGLNRIEWHFLWKQGYKHRSPGRKGAPTGIYGDEQDLVGAKNGAASQDLGGGRKRRTRRFQQEHKNWRPPPPLPQQKSVDDRSSARVFTYPSHLIIITN